MFGLGKTSSDKMMESLYGGAHTSLTVADDEPKEVTTYELAQRLTASGAITADGSGLAAYDDGSWGWMFHNGEKFGGSTGFGGNSEIIIDYWALRQKSAELFQRNLFARGAIRRLTTNVIATGLALESVPAENVLGLSEGTLDDWTDLTEERFELWAGDPKLCDFHGEKTFGEIQELAYREALVDGDILVLERMHPTLRVPQIQLIDGKSVQSPPLDMDNRERDIRHGVELDKSGRQIAYWVVQEDGSFRRLPAYGPKSKRRLAWLFYASDKRMDEVRGQPILAQILQALKELDRFMDASIRKVVVNSVLAMFIETESDGIGSRALSAGAVRSGTKVATGEGGQGAGRLKSESMSAGLVIDRLAVGEKIKAMPTAGADTGFQEFTDGILKGIAWSLSIPPEILTLSFNSNYSASAAAINEFGIYLSVVRTNIGNTLCKPFYKEWLVSEVLEGRIVADGFISAWRLNNGDGRYTFAAWVRSEWSGQVKPSTDVHKQARGLQLLLNNGLISFDRASRLATGTKWRTNVKKQKREREIALDAKVPLMSDAAAFQDAGDAESQPVEGEKS